MDKHEEWMENDPEYRKAYLRESARLAARMAAPPLATISADNAYSETRTDSASYVKNVTLTNVELR